MRDLTLYILEKEAMSEDDKKRNMLMPIKGERSRLQKLNDRTGAKRKLYAVLGDGPSGKKVRYMKDDQNRLLYSEDTDHRNPIAKAGGKRMYAGGLAGGLAGGALAGKASKFLGNSRFGKAMRGVSGAVGALGGVYGGTRAAYGTYTPDQKASRQGAKYKTSFKGMARQSLKDEYTAAGNDINNRLRALGPSGDVAKINDLRQAGRELISDYHTDLSKKEQKIRDAYRK